MPKATHLTQIFFLSILLLRCVFMPRLKSKKKSIIAPVDYAPIDVVFIDNNSKNLQRTSSYIVEWSETNIAHILFITFLALLIAAAPKNELFTDRGIFFGIGILALWRYSWGFLHFARSNIYRRVVFPRLRREADRHTALAKEGGRVPDAFLIVTSFRIDGDTTAKVYRAAFKAALNAPGRATVVASIVEMGDQRLVRSMHRLICGNGSDVDLVIVRINGSGKRDALAYAFRAVAKLLPQSDDVVAVIDGDSIVPEDLVRRCAGFFSADPTVGALTTDEVSSVRGHAAFHLWYSLRFAQRDILMSSNGLARRVLTLTGRMSMFRASVICNPDFVRQVEEDYIDHWRLGRVKFLTGDDKSSWFWLLRKGYRMLYVPDVTVATVEDPPTAAFIPAAAQLMTRWFGNMLRTNGRA
ncbi:MAG: glycosyltransferase, partial [Rhizobium sp.]